MMSTRALYTASDRSLPPVAFSGLHVRGNQKMPVHRSAAVPSQRSPSAPPGSQAEAQN